MVKSLIVACAGVLLNVGAAIADDNEPKVVAKNPAAAVAVGQALPPFAATDDAGQPWKSSEHVGKKVVVLYFYPGDFTGGCTRQAQTYRDALASIEALGAEVVGVSGDKPSTHQLFKATYGLEHTLLSDTEGKLAALFGIPVKGGGKLRATGPDRAPLRDAKGDRIDIERPVTVARWTAVIAADGSLASLRSVSNLLTDAEEVSRIVAALAQNGR